MNQKKKQSIVAVVATVLTVTCVMSPIVSVYATETDTTIITQESETRKIKSVQENTEVLIDKDTFPDEEFKNYVKTNFDKNPDDKLTTDEISNIKSIDIWGINNITDLQGIEKFTYLTKLDCSNTGITSLNVSENTALEYLDCYDTGISGLDVSENTALIELDCSNTGITSLNVSKNKALEYLNCSDTGISGLDVSENTALTKLDCYSNKQLTDLKVKGATSLIYLDCYDTGINSLDVSENTALTDLNCYSNKQLADLKVKGATSLINLDYSDTGINSLDVSENKALEYLICSNTGITSLDVSENTALTDLDCSSNKQLTDLKVKGATSLIYLDCSNTGIKSLDVSDKKDLEYLACYSTRISSLNVSNNESLETLKCAGTRISSLDVSNNKNLTELRCANIGISSLNVSNNTSLVTLDCQHTGIISLDVSKNTNLNSLFCNNIPLAYLNLGTNNKLIYFDKYNLQPVEIGVNGEAFNVKEIFPDITTDKIKIESGAEYDEKTGVMSKYTFGKTITYEYDCGAANNNPTTIKVSLLPLRKSTISIKKDLSKTYDGTAVSEKPGVEKEGSKEDVTYKWEHKNSDDHWEVIDSAPKDVGTYRVTATLPSNNDYKGATTTEEFVISKATNSWVNDLVITDWIYNETDNKPTATAKFGTVDYLYSGSKNGTYTDVVPTNAGTWYVKASVAGTENYTGLETIIAFKIEPKNVENNKITVSDIKNDKDIENLVVKDEDKVLEKGTDYEVEKKQKGNKVDVVITFKGNYTGTITKSYTVDVDKPKEEPKDSVSVSTGDTTHTGLLAMITLLSASCIVFLTGKKRRKEF